MTAAIAISESPRDFDPLENADLLIEIARALVDHPEDVEVIEKSQGNATFLTLRVAKADRGKMIGRGGDTINAVRSIFKRIGAADSQRVHIEVEDDPKQKRKRRSQRQT